MAFPQPPASLPVPSVLHSLIACGAFQNLPLRLCLGRALLLEWADLDSSFNPDSESVTSLPPETKMILGYVGLLGGTHGSSQSP